MSKFGYHTCNTNQNASKQHTICMILGSNGGVAEGWTLLGSDTYLLGKYVPVSCSPWRNIASFLLGLLNHEDKHTTIVHNVGTYLLWLGTTTHKTSIFSNTVWLVTSSPHGLYEQIKGVINIYIHIQYVSNIPLSEQPTWNWFSVILICTITRLINEPTFQIQKYNIQDNLLTNIWLQNVEYTMTCKDKLESYWLSSVF